MVMAKRVAHPDAVREVPRERADWSAECRASKRRSGTLIIDAPQNGRRRHRSVGFPVRPVPSPLPLPSPLQYDGASP
jgi:hypothetical protein